MEHLLKLLTPYEIRARILPGLMLIVPGVLLVIEVVPSLRSLPALGGVGILTFLAAFPAGQWMRDRAQPKQAALFDSWGGAPTTQLLRWSNTLISIQEKQRARATVLALDGFEWPDQAQAAQAPVEADAHFKTIVGAILSDARTQPGKYERMNHANAQFGFMRNCFYSRTAGALTSGLVMILSSLLTLTPAMAVAWEVPTLIGILCFVLMLYWVWGITDERLKISGEAFAIETFHHIPTFVKGQRSS